MAAANQLRGGAGEVPDVSDMAFLQPLWERMAARDRISSVPFVTLSYAQSIDGSIAARPARPFLLSSEQSFAMTHLLRSRHDALLVGINTVLVDDPRLTVRLCKGANPQPVVVDSTLRCPEEARLFAHPDRRPVLLTTAAAPAGTISRLQKRGALVHVVPNDARGRIDLEAALHRLAGLGVKRLMVEGGASIISSFLEHRLVDYCVITLVPKLIGGIRAMDNQRPSQEFPPLSIIDCRYQPLGVDLIIHGSLTKT